MSFEQTFVVMDHYFTNLNKEFLKKSKYLLLNKKIKNKY